VDITAATSRLTPFLDAGTVDDPPTPVRILFDDDGASIWTTNQTRTLQVFVDRWNVLSSLAKPCVLLVNPKELSNLLKLKFQRDETVRITTDTHSMIRIQGETTGAEINCSDEDECLTIPDRWVLPIVDGVRTFPMFRNEPADYVIEMSMSQLKNCLKDMKVAKAPYVELFLNEKHRGEGRCMAGHWTSKTTRSWSDVEYDSVLEPTSWTIRFSENLDTILRKFSTDTTEVRISKHREGAFVIIDSTDGEFTSVLATEAVKE
jgi:hypothetical protein